MHGFFAFLACLSLLAMTGCVSLMAFVATYSSVISVVTLAPLAITITGAAIGGATFTYGYTYFTLFPTSNFNICELKQQHLDKSDPVLQLLSPLSKHFWESEYAPVCIDDIDDDSAPPTTGKITLDILQQKGWKPQADYVIEHIPSFVAHYLGIPSTVEDLCSKADSYIDPLLKKSSWYAETINEETEVPPATHASVSFKDFMKWSLDFVFETYGDLLPESDQVRSQLGQLIDDVGVQSLKIFEQIRLIVAAAPELTAEDCKKVRDYALFFTRAFASVVHNVLTDLEGRLNSFLTLQASEAKTSNFRQWFAKLGDDYFWSFVEGMQRSIHWCADEIDVKLEADREKLQLKLKTILYDVLDLSPGATMEQIESAYHELADKYHQDKVPMDQRTEATTKLLDIQEAYDVLSNNYLRWIYDKRGYHHAMAAKNFPDTYQTFNPVPKGVPALEDSGRS